MTSVSAPLGSSAFFTPLITNFKNAFTAASQSAARLSSGNSILNVGDNVGAFAISAGLQSQLASLNQGTSNAAQGSSLLQVAQGGLQQISNILNEMQSIAEQATSSSLTDTQRGFLQQQFAQDLGSIDNIANGTSFNGVNLLDGSLTAAKFQVGSSSTNKITVAITGARTSTLFTGTPDVTDTGNAADAQTAISTASNTILSMLSNIGGLQTAFNTASANLQQSIIGITAANSNLADTDIVAESTNYATEKLKVNAGAAVIAQALNLPSTLLVLLRPVGNA